MRQIRTEADLDAVLAEPLVLLYKHSPICGTSGIAYDEVVALAARYDDLPIYLVDVVSHRPLARLVTERTGITHESPQVIILLAGSPAWHASHHGIRTATIARQLDLLRAAL